MKAWGEKSEAYGNYTWFLISIVKHLIDHLASTLHYFKEVFALSK